MKTQIPLFKGTEETSDIVSRPDPRAIEDPLFPFEKLSKIAEQESWRKEVNRPIYHIHKWWAQRLGSVFRALALAASAPAGADVLRLFYGKSRIDEVVFDPFMGSGTTLGEVLKLGGRAIGQDINPVAFFLVNNALHLPQRDEVLSTFRQIEADAAGRILDLYSAKLPDGRTGQVLYFFWVKVVSCPSCEGDVDLFPSYVFAQNAYPNRRPDVRIVCPGCGAIHQGIYGAERTECPACHLTFNPQQGPARKNDATCGCCGNTLGIVSAVRKTGRPPGHRLYAKLVVDSEGKKSYLATDDYDRTVFQKAVRELSERQGGYPELSINDGYNTRQVLNYCYRSWHEMFNERQLLCLGILADRIRAIPDERQRELFCCLFSGTLEFNNMFASYKGEGTGAVRHMFSHHVLKPERTPIEANVWGTPYSSGSFSTLFRGRILRAIDYAEDPFEIRPDDSGGKPRKVFGISEPLLSKSNDDRLQLRCGDSSNTDLPSESVDAIITDPPFFDNVHYSELADFFHVWQRHVLGERGLHAKASTRAAEEVQHGDSGVFEGRLAGVWSECRRVLKRDGLMVFTFHHSRAEGWRSVLGSLAKSGMRAVCVHPIRSEMSVAAPKHQAKEPISIDVIFVCRRFERATPFDAEDTVRHAREAASRQLERLLKAGFEMSKNDVRVLVLSNAVQVLSCCQPDTCVEALLRIEPKLEDLAVELASHVLRLQEESRVAQTSATLVWDAE